MVETGSKTHPKADEQKPGGPGLSDNTHVKRTESFPPPLWRTLLCTDTRGDPGRTEQAEANFSQPREPGRATFNK